MKPFCLYSDNKVKAFQFKILHRIIGVNYLLYKMSKVPSNKCDLCYMYPETIEHLFFECFEAKKFWFDLLHEWNNYKGTNLELSQRDVILGYQIEDQTAALDINLLLSMGKKYIYMCKIGHSTLCPENFKKYLLSSYRFHKVNVEQSCTLLYFIL